MLALNLVLSAVFIISAPAVLIRYISYRCSIKTISKIGIDVKNQLLSGKDYLNIDENVIRLVKRNYLKNHIIGLIISFIAVFAAAFLYFNTDDTPFMLIVYSLIFPFPIILKICVGLVRLSDKDKLIKIKGFVFLTRNDEARILYYDRQKLEFRFFVQGMLFEKSDLLECGRIVNLVAKRGKKRVYIIKALTF